MRFFPMRRWSRQSPFSAFSKAEAIFRVPVADCSSLGTDCTGRRHPERHPGSSHGDGTESARSSAVSSDSVQTLKWANEPCRFGAQARTTSSNRSLRAWTMPTVRFRNRRSGTAERRLFGGFRRRRFVRSNGFPAKLQPRRHDRIRNEFGPK